MYKYPNDLIIKIDDIYKKIKRNKYYKPPKLPSASELEILIETAYQASFLTEEGRRVGFRIIYIQSKNNLSCDDQGRYYRNKYRFIPFDVSRPYTISEINKVSPAAELTRLLLCVTNEPSIKGEVQLKLCGLLDVGENWWKFINHESSGGYPPPNYYTITSQNPGEISISLQGDVLATLRNGDISSPQSSPIWSGPVYEFLQPARKKLYNTVVAKLAVKQWSKEDDEYPLNFYNFYMERILFYVRNRSHGGTIIIVPGFLTKDDTRLTDRINIKYPCTYNNAFEELTRHLVNHKKYYDLHFPMWNNTVKYSQKVFQEYHMLSCECEEIGEAISDIAKAVASLTSVDGAVVMTDTFDVLGFGAEVLVTSPSLKEVTIVKNIKSQKNVSIESFGTRHRSAFRFCSSFEDSVAFVVSQDGGVKAIKRVGKDVLMWPDINTGSMGL